MANLHFTFSSHKVSKLKIALKNLNEQKRTNKVSECRWEIWKGDPHSEEGGPQGSSRLWWDMVYSIQSLAYWWNFEGSGDQLELVIRNGTEVTQETVLRCCLLSCRWMDRWVMQHQQVMLLKVMQVLQSHGSMCGPWMRWEVQHQIGIWLMMSGYVILVFSMRWCLSVSPSICLGWVCILVIRCTLARI